MWKKEIAACIPYVLKLEALRFFELSMNQMDEGSLSTKLAALEMWVKEIKNDFS
jgi:hypothetical protein